MWCLSAHNVRLSMSEQKKSARRLISSSFLVFRNQNHFTRNRIRQPSNLSHSIFLMLYSSPAHLTSPLFRHFFIRIRSCERIRNLIFFYRKPIYFCRMKLRQSFCFSSHYEHDEAFLLSSQIHLLFPAHPTH